MTTRSAPGTRVDGIARRLGSACQLEAVASCQPCPVLGTAATSPATYHAFASIVRGETAESTERTYAAAMHGCLPIRNASFVAPLISWILAAPAKHGFPYGGFFLLLDDIEYTGRILRNEFGVSVPRSLVYHKTKRAALAHQVGPNYFFFDLRNTLWMVRLSKVYAPSEKVSFAGYTARTAVRFLLYHRFAGVLEIDGAGNAAGSFSQASQDLGELSRDEKCRETAPSCRGAVAVQTGEIGDSFIRGHE